MLITPFSGDVSHPGKPFKAEGAEKRGGWGVGVKGRGIWVKWCSPLLLHLSRNIKAPVMGTQVDSELFHSRLCPRPESMEPLILLRSAAGREDVSYLPANTPLMFFIRRLRVLSVWVSRWSAWLWVLGPLVPMRRNGVVFKVCNAFDKTRTRSGKKGFSFIRRFIWDFLGIFLQTVPHYIFFSEWPPECPQILESLMGYLALHTELHLHDVNFFFFAILFAV